MKSIAIDFDGVIHSYENGWKDGSIYGQPIEGVFEGIQKLMENYTVFIFSTRSPRQIKRWLRDKVYESSYIAVGFGEDPEDFIWPKYGFEVKIIPFWVKFWNKPNVLGITKRKLPAQVYVDDRALTFFGNWEQTLDSVNSFKTYQEK